MEKESKKRKKENKVMISELQSLLSHNTEKMNFQQEMSFQIRNWAIAITLGFLGFVWSDIASETICFKYYFHYIVLMTLVMMLYFDISWFKYFFVFRDRVISIEDSIIQKIEDDKFKYKYYSQISIDGRIKDKKKSFKKGIFECIEIYLILFILISLIFFINKNNLFK